MQISQFTYKPQSGWHHIQGDQFDPDLVLAFGSGRDCSGDIIVKWWEENYPKSQLVGCSTSGEICKTTVSTNTISATAIKFDQTEIKTASVQFAPQEDSLEIGRKLASLIPHENLKHCFVLTEGLNINGTHFVTGLESVLPENTPITGGLAGDGKRFEQTQVCFNEDFGSNRCAIVGFYGDNIDISYASFGGWDTFGPNRRVTKVEDNILYEMDDKSALALYKEYLGEYAKDLPSSGLLFPLKISTPDGKEFVRTLLGINEETDAMVFAGDIPEGSYARLMRANFERLIDGASEAAKSAFGKHIEPPELAILISCVGRRLVLNQRAEEEVEAVSDIFNDQTPLTGFYSYGEICPLQDDVSCTLHNQTMTITTFKERLPESLDSDGERLNK